MTPGVWFLVWLAGILLAARLLGRVAVAVGQPRVIGEILVGVVLGPTMLATWAGQPLIPEAVLPVLGGIYGLAVALSHWYPSQHRLGSVLVLGIAMAVTAFPVLARILTDPACHDTGTGRLAPASVAVQDLIAWIMLAGVAALVTDVPSCRMALVVPYGLIMLTLVRPLLRALLRGGTGSAMSVVLPGLLLSAAATEWMGPHTIFGAFLFGAMMPRSTRTPETAGLRSRLGPFSRAMLPVYFVLMGQQIGVLRLEPRYYLTMAAILLVAVTGKFLGAHLGTRLCGIDHGQASNLGVLMNTRGLTEVIILTTGLHRELLDRTMFTLMLLMALTTTAMTGPLLNVWPVGEPASAGPSITTAWPMSTVPTKEPDQKELDHADTTTQPQTTDGTRDRILGGQDPRRRP